MYNMLHKLYQNIEIDVHEQRNISAKYSSHIVLTKKIASLSLPNVFDVFHYNHNCHFGWL